MNDPFGLGSGNLTKTPLVQGPPDCNPLGLQVPSKKLSGVGARRVQIPSDEALQGHMCSLDPNASRSLDFLLLHLQTSRRVSCRDNVIPPYPAPKAAPRRILPPAQQHQCGSGTRSMSLRDEDQLNMGRWFSKSGVMYPRPSKHPM